MDEKSYFLLNVTGEVDSGCFPGITDLYCKYCYVFGPDWGVVAGTEEGWSQTAKKALDGEEDFVWNLPLDISFRSTNPQGWPQIVFGAYGLDYAGRDVVRGYGAVHLPTSQGRWTKRVAMFVPESASLLQRFGSWITGTRPEYVDPRVVAGGDGREVTRVRTQGYVTVKFNAVFKDFHELGYVSSPGHRDVADRSHSVPALRSAAKAPAPQPPTRAQTPSVQQVQSDVERMSLGTGSARAETPSAATATPEPMPMAMEKTRPKPERRRKKSAPSPDVISAFPSQSSEIQAFSKDDS